MWLGPRRVDGVALVARLPSTDTAALVLLSGPLPPRLVLRRILVAWLREPGARPAQTGLDFVKQQQEVALVAQAAQAGEPALRRNDNACLSLYWLDEHGGVGRDRRLHRREVSERGGAKARREGPEAVAKFRLRGETDNRRGAAVKIPLGDDDHGTQQALDAMPPSARRLNRRLRRARERPAAARSSSRSIGSRRSRRPSSNDSCRQLGEHMLHCLAALHSPALKEVRGRGLWAGAEIDPQFASAREVCERPLENGVLSNAAEAFGRDLSRFECNKSRQFRPGGAQFLGEQADEGASARRRDFSPDAKRVFRIGDGGTRQLGVVKLRPPDQLAGDRRARLGRSTPEGLGRNAHPPKYLCGVSSKFARQWPPPCARPAQPLCSESRAGRADLITYLMWSGTGLAKSTHHKVVRLAPPLVIAREDLDFAIHRFEEVLAEIVEARRQGASARSGPFVASCASPAMGDRELSRRLRDH